VMHMHIPESPQAQFKSLLEWLTVMSPSDVALLEELLEVARGLKQRAEAGVNPDNTELMQRARRLLDR
jgi:hypothetical protein